MPDLTLRDVATFCGVSTATVSAVVNGAEWVSPATRVRVQRAVDEMGYRPNQFARGLKTQRGYAVGVIVSDLTNPFFTEVVRSLSHALHAGGRAHFLVDTDHRSDVGESSLRMLADNHVVGLVLIGDSVPGDTVRRYVRRRGHVPIVAIERDYDLESEGVSTLLVDSELGAYTMVRHLLGQGHRRIALITGPTHGGGSATFGREQRLAGYQRALCDTGIAPDPRLVVEGNFRYGGGQQAMRRLLGSGRLPDAVFASNDMMALGAMSVLRDAGLRIPDDIAIAGFDDIPPAALTTPGLTTMAMPMSELGRAAAQVLAEQMAGTAIEAARKVFDPQLVVRHSSGGRAGARPAA